jgi:hypothetical protein
MKKMEEAGSEAQMRRLEQAIERLAEAQALTEVSLKELAQAQARTEAQMRELASAQQELFKAQARTEAQVRELAQAQARTEAQVRELAQAQARTEAQVRELAQAQARTEAQVRELAQAQARTEAQVRELAQAQARTEAAIRQLARQVGALSENIGYGLEDIARLVLPGYLERKYGLKVDKLVRGLFLVDGVSVDIDLYGKGERDGKRIAILGEVKSRIYRREVESFQEKLDLVEPQIEEEVVKLMFGYFIDLSAMEEAGKEILLIASYQPAVELG